MTITHLQALESRPSSTKMKKMLFENLISAIRARVHDYDSQGYFVEYNSQNSDESDAELAACKFAKKCKYLLIRYFLDSELPKN